MRARQAVLAIDLGTKRTGFAVADALRITSTPLETFHGAEDSGALLDHVEKLLDERDVDTFVVGLPLNMDGTEGARCAAVRAFIERLSARFPKVRVVAHDERLTTKAAEDLLRDRGHHGREARAMRDSYSALVLLHAWLQTEALPPSSEDLDA